jgi:formylglycine-generating enzyme required for sulfatase activity
VKFERGFRMRKSEVTQRVFREVTGYNPSQFLGDSERPVENVNCCEAQLYCERLTVQERAAGRLADGEHRLPTEAAWEYACRAGTTTAAAFGASLGLRQAHFDARYPYNGGQAATTAPVSTLKVGSFPPNAWGLFDLHGNVAEWCADSYGPYPGNDVLNPYTEPHPPGAGVRVCRGGSLARSRGGLPVGPEGRWR